MKINNVYKKILILYVSIFIFYIQAKGVEKTIQSVVKKTTRRDSKGIDKLDHLIKQKTLSILKTLAVDFDAVTNRLVDLASNLAALTLVVNNLSITNQLGLIQTSSASPILNRHFVVVGFCPDVVMYNTDIRTALAAISIALHTPSKKNTAAAQSALAVAITDFDMIDSLVSVSSPYSVSEIHAALMQLNAQLAYLYSLQV